MSLYNSVNSAAGHGRFRVRTICFCEKLIIKEIEETYKAAKLFLQFSSIYLGTSQLKDKIPCCTTSFCVYSFTSFCGTSYIGRTTRRLSDRVREHHPFRLSKGQVRNTYTSAILNHLIESNHNVDIKRSFNIVYRIPYHIPKLTKFRLLAISEAISIRLCDPELCSQNDSCELWISLGPQLNQRSYTNSTHYVTIGVRMFVNDCFLIHEKATRWQTNLFSVIIIRSITTQFIWN